MTNIFLSFFVIPAYRDASCPEARRTHPYRLRSRGSNTYTQSLGRTYSGRVIVRSFLMPYHLDIPSQEYSQAFLAAIRHLTRYKKAESADSCLYACVRCRHDLKSQGVWISCGRTRILPIRASENGQSQIHGRGPGKNTKPSGRNMMRRALPNVLTLTIPGLEQHIRGHSP